MYSLKNTLTGQTISDLNSVPEGIYKIEVTDNRGCITEYHEAIYIAKLFKQLSSIYSRQ